MALRHRVKRLEGGRGGCEECGWGLPDTKYAVVWDDGWGQDGSFDPEETTYCPSCGLPDPLVITWGDADERYELDELDRLRHEEAQRQLRERT